MKRPNPTIRKPPQTTTTLAVKYEIENLISALGIPNGTHKGPL